MASMSNLDNYVDHDIYQRYSDERPWMEVVGHHKSEDHSNQKVSTTMLATVQESRSYNFRRKPINFLESPWIFRHSPKDLGDYPGCNLNIPHLSGKKIIIHQPKGHFWCRFPCPLNSHAKSQVWRFGRDDLCPDLRRDILCPDHVESSNWLAWWSTRTYPCLG